MRQQSTTQFLSVVCSAMWPALRPISFMSPTPFAALSASTCAAALACYAASTAGWNQKERSMMPTSLSTVCGLRDASDVHEEVAPPHLLEDLHQSSHRVTSPSMAYTWLNPNP